MRWILVLLAFLAAWMVFVAYIIGSVPDATVFGLFFLAIGLVNIIACKTTARRVFSWAISSRPFIARVWLVGGTKGLEILYLGIGVIFAVAGSVELAMGYLGRSR
jgi:hypothetical protein